MDYKPGQVAASLFQTKKKSSNPLLNDLFNKKAEPAVTVKAQKSPNEKKEQKSKKKKEKDKVGNALKEIANTEVKKDKKADIKQQTAGIKRKHENTNTTVKNDKKAGVEKKRDEVTTHVKNAKKAVIKGNNEEVKTHVKNNKKAGTKRKHEDTAASPTKSKKEEKEASVSEQTQSTQNPDKFPFIHESLLKKSQQQKSKKVKKTKIDDDDEPQDQRRTRRKRDKTSDKRTVFVGNCPLSADKKVMKSLFTEYGPIETIRFRCGPTAKLELPKRAVMIKREFHDKASSYVCFIVFKEEETAAKALQKNGHVLDGHHLRVDLASNQNQHDKRRSVFVGNLPFTVTEEDLRSHFEDCGDILNVRIIRDRQTSLGKGIAYIQFDSRDGVLLAQKLNDMEFQERKLRVMRCSSKAKVKKTEDNPRTTKTNPRLMKNKTQSKPVAFKGKAKEFYSRSDPRPEKRKTNFAPTNKSSTTKSFRDIFEAKKEKRVNNMKKKKQRSQKQDGLSSIFGDIPANMKKLKMDNPKLINKKIKKSKDRKKEKKAKKKLKKAS